MCRVDRREDLLDLLFLFPQIVLAETVYVPLTREIAKPGRDEGCIRVLVDIEDLVVVRFFDVLVHRQDLAAHFLKVLRHVWMPRFGRSHVKALRNCAQPADELGFVTFPLSTAPVSSRFPAPAAG